MGDRFSGLRDDDDFFALGDPIKELNNVCGGFGKGDLGNHGFPSSGGFMTARWPSELRMLSVECGKVLFNSQFNRNVNL